MLYLHVGHLIWVESYPAHLFLYLLLILLRLLGIHDGLVYQLNLLLHSGNITLNFCRLVCDCLLNLLYLFFVIVGVVLPLAL